MKLLINRPVIASIDVMNQESMKKILEVFCVCFIKLSNTRRKLRNQVQYCSKGAQGEISCHNFVKHPSATSKITIIGYSVSTAQCSLIELETFARVLWAISLPLQLQLL